MKPADIKIMKELEKFEKAFTQWDLDYRTNPEKYMNDVEHLLDNTPYSYGKAAALYFQELLGKV